MPNVNIPAITIEYEGVVYAASWDASGVISYKGVDKEGKEISEIPGAVAAKARSYGASFGSDGNENKDDAKPDNGEEKGLEHFEIDTDGKGGWTLKSGDKSKLSPKQLEWCEMMAKNAAQRGENNDVSGTQKAGADGSQETKSASNSMNDWAFEDAKNSYTGFLKYKGITRIQVDNFGDERFIAARDKNGRPIHLSSEENKYILDKLDTLKLRHKENNRGSFKSLARGFETRREEIQRNLRQMNQDTPFQMARDSFKFGEIAQGEFKEAIRKAANRIADNLKAMIGLGRPDESKLYNLTKNMRENVEEIKAATKQVGRDFKNKGKGLKRLFGLSGRTGTQAVQSVVVPKSNTRGKQVDR